MEGIQQVIEEHHEDLNLEMQMNEIQLNSGEYNEVRVVLNDPIRHLMTTAVSFDSHEQLTWTGSHSVRNMIFTNHLVPGFSWSFIKFKINLYC